MLPSAQVKIWFQNRRMKWRNSKERESLYVRSSMEELLFRGSEETAAGESLQEMDVEKSSVQQVENSPPKTPASQHKQPQQQQQQHQKHYAVDNLTASPSHEIEKLASSPSSTASSSLESSR